jgi:hypothetical protein
MGDHVLDPSSLEKRIGGSLDSLKHVLQEGFVTSLCQEISGIRPLFPGRFVSDGALPAVDEILIIRLALHFVQASTLENRGTGQDDPLMIFRL